MNPWNARTGITAQRIDYATETDWLNFRKLGIGGSDIGAICGKNPWSSPVKVWADKTNRIPEMEPSERMEIGKDIEDFIAALFCKREGKEVERVNALLQHSEYPHFIASVDRIIRPKGYETGWGVLEIKNVSQYSIKDWEDVERLPDSYYLQLQWYLFVTGLQWGAFAALIGGQRFVVHYVDRDPVLIQSLSDIADAFWMQNVQADVMPEIDGSDATQDVIVMLNGEPSKKETIPLPLEARELIAQYYRAKELSKAAEEMETQAKTKLLNILHEHETGLIDAYSVKHKVVVTSRLDTAALKKRHPRAAEKYIKQSTSHQISITKQ